MTTLAPQHHVLIVEDEEESGYLVEASLKSIEGKIKIDWVKTAEEAEGVLKDDSNYDLIIADHFLDGPKTGLDLWKKCQQKYRNVPFLMTSAMDPNVFSILVADEPEQPMFLHKPFRIDECKNMLEWFWEEESEKSISYVDLKASSNYQVIIMGVLLLLVILMSSEMEFIKVLPFKTPIYYSPIISDQNLAPPLKLIIPTFNQNLRPKHFRPSRKHKGLIQEILSAGLKKEVLMIQLRADEVLESLGSNLEGRHLPRGLSDFDGRFEKYGHIQRPA